MVKVFALAASVLVFANAASAEILVFKSGRTMSVQSYRVDGDMATAVLRAGGEVSFPSAIITRVDPGEVPYPARLVSSAVRPPNQARVPVRHLK